MALIRTTTADPASVAAAVESVDSSTWSADPSTYTEAVLEQYKLYVEMADRVSARRALANTFFLTLNSAVFVVFGVVWEHRPNTTAWWLLFPLIALVGECSAWYWMLRSYRQLNSAKYIVIGSIEKRLPLSPYWQAEWLALGKGKEPSCYVPLTHMEQWVPILFITTYIGSFLAAVIA